VVSALRRLAALLREEGGPLAEAVTAPDPHVDGAGRHGALAAAGPRAEGHEADYELLVEAIREGYLLHYADREGARVVATDDPDLALLAGDRLYALGLARLAELGDLAAVGELADVISLSARAHAAGDGALADAVWEAGAVAVGWGGGDDHAAAKAAARNGDPDAAGALLAAARQASAKLAPER
jgi:hypothetical protein